MNKTLLTLAIACTLSWMGAHAQPIMSYDFESKVGNYDEITDGTIVLENDSLGKALNAIAFYGSGIDDRATTFTTKAGIPIGFDFVFNNTVMKQFIIGGNGFLAFGENKIAIDPTNPYFFVTAFDKDKNNNVVVSIRNAETHGDNDTKISYKVTGEEGSRVLIIQYKNLRFMDRWGEEFLNKAQLQFRIYEGSNKIEIIYKDWKRNDTGYALDTRVGIKGSMKGDMNNNIPDDVLMLKASSNWSEASTTSNTNGLSWGSESYPPDGLTFTFIPCKDCEAPTAQPTNLILEPKTISVSGSFDKTATADHYLTVISETATLSETPQDNTYYKSNDVIGNGTVISFDTTNTFTTPESLILSGAKKYYIHVFGSNTFCMFGPKYNTNSPLTKEVITMPAAPASLEIAENGYEKVVLKAEKDAAGNKILIAMTMEYSRDNVNNITINGKFGQPTGNMKVGDVMEEGGKVIYIGDASTTIPVEGLENNNLYHFKAWSIDKDGKYSTEGANANVLTWGRLPYEPKYEQMPKGRPYSWEGEGEDDAFSINEFNGYRLFTRVKASQNGAVNTLITPWVLLGEGRNRFILDLNIFIYGKFGGSNTPYNDWKENDLFEIQISKDGNEFKPIATFNKENAPQLKTADAYARLYIPVDTLSNEKVKFRVYWKCYTAVDCYIKNIKIEERGECDYPINPSVDANSIIGDQALVSWKSQGEENSWDIRYRIATDNDGVEQEWSNPLEVNTNPYLLTGLPTQKNIELQVRAKCSMTSQSVWSETLKFTTGYGVPFTEKFASTELPNGWEFKTGAIADPTEFCEGNQCNSQWKWVSSIRQKGLFLSPAGASADEWLLMPVIDMEDGSANYTLSFNIMMATPGTATDEAYYVVVSTDGGTTFNSKNAIDTISKSEFPEAYAEKTYTISLKGLKGKIRPALYVKATDGSASYVQLKKVSVDATCPSDIEAAVSDITTESAKVTWTSEAEEFYVFIRKAGETKKDYEKMTVKEKSFNELEARTNYEVGITKMCAIGDTAKVTIIPFTTLALAPCEQVTNITEAISQFSATITWEGEAENYNIRYRQKNAADWITKNTSENLYKIEGLETEKEYEYEIQSVCSAAPGDQSDWTEAKSFTTLPVTCFPPSNIKAVPTYKSATVTWEGEADKYEINFRKGTDEWTTSEVTGKSKEFTGLDAETAYSVRLRSKCSENDISLWSATIDFTTEAIPQCVTPTNLTVTSLTSSSAKLSWDADESNLSWDIHYRPSSSTAWIDEKGLTEKTYDLTNLTENTAYIWAVKATCDEGRTSAWSTQNKFTTDASGISETSMNALNVFVSGNALNIINGEHCWIDNIQIYSVNGQLLNAYIINSDENVLIQMNLKHSKVLVKINGKEWTKTYPVLF